MKPFRVLLILVSVFAWMASSGPDGVGAGSHELRPVRF